MQGFEQESQEEAEMQSIGSRAVSLSSFLLLAKLISVLISGAALVIVARILGPSAYGVFAIAVAVAGTFGAMGNFGVGNMFSKSIAEHAAGRGRPDVERLLSNGFAVVLALGVSLTVISVAASGYLSTYLFHNQNYTQLIRLTSLSIVLSMLFSSAYAALVGLADGKATAIASVSQVLAQATVSASLAIAGLGAVAPAAGLDAGFVIGFALAVAMLYRKHGLRAVRPTKKGIGEVLRFSAPLGVSNLYTSIAQNATPMVLALLTTTEVVGDFGVALKIYNLLSIFTDSIGAALLPVFSSALSSRNVGRSVGRFFNYSVFATTLVLAAPMLATALLSTQVVLVLVGGTYLKAAAYVAILSVGVVFGVAGTFGLSLMIGRGLVRDVLKYNSAIMVVQLALLWPLVYYLGGTGAALLMFLITPLVTTLLFLRGIGMDLGAKLAAGRLARVVLASAASAALVIPLTVALGNPVLLILAAAAEQLIAYPALAGLSGALTSRDLRLAKAATKSVPAIRAFIEPLTAYAALFTRT